MGFTKYINIPLFFISFLFGLLAMYITMPDNRKILIYPTPENVAILQYRDKTDTCFSFKEKEVDCPSDEKEITKIPIQS